MNFWRDVTDNIIRIIAESGKSYSQIAREIGVSPQSVNKYISGKGYPDYEKLRRLCRALDCTYEDILGEI